MPERLGALFAGAMAGGIVLAVPVPLFELAASSTGLSELLPVFAPPIGWDARILVALVAAILAAGFVWALDGVTASRKGGKASSTKGKPAMGLGWHQITRFARGTHDAANDGPVAMPSLDALTKGLEAFEAEADTLKRRRADHHPDAPPRPPLFASRDLPPLAVVSDMKVDAAPVAVLERDVAPVVVAPVDLRLVTTEDVPVVAEPVVAEAAAPALQRPLPRSPQPMSDSEMAEICKTLPPLPARTAAPDLKASPLLSLVDHFEQQVDRHLVGTVAVQPAMPLVAVEAGAEADAQPATTIAPHDEDSLRLALEALKRLSERTRKN